MATATDSSTIITISVTLASLGTFLTASIIICAMYRERHNEEGPLRHWYGRFPGRKNKAKDTMHLRHPSDPALEAPTKIHEVRARPRMRELKDPRTCCHELDPGQDARRELPGSEFPELMTVAIRDGYC